MGGRLRTHKVLSVVKVRVRVTTLNVLYHREYTMVLRVHHRLRTHMFVSPF